MKRLLLFFTICGLGLITAFAQVPQAMSYQGVARDANGACIASQTISLQLSILDTTETGPILYQERHFGVQTNAQGLFNIIIGADPALATGAGRITDFSEATWHDGVTRWMRVAMDPAGGGSFVPVGTQQFLTVPYAMFAGNGKRLSQGNQDEFMRFYGTNGNNNVSIGGIGSGGIYNNGIIRGGNSDGDTRVQMFSGDIWGGAGGVLTRGSNGTQNVVLSIRDGRNSPNRDRGAIRIYDENGVEQIYLGIDALGNGVLLKDQVSFVMDHPTRKDKNIVYACIEGPEAAAYERGTLKLVNGEAEVRFSEHFEIVANPATMTVVITPRSADSKGLAAFEYTATGFKVKELFQGTGSYEFDWEAKAVRKGYEDYEVIRDKMEDPNLDLEDK